MLWYEFILSFESDQMFNFLSRDCLAKHESDSHRNETSGNIVGIVSRLPDHTSGISFPLVFRSGAYSGVLSKGVGVGGIHYHCPHSNKHTKIVWAGGNHVGTP